MVMWKKNENITASLEYVEEAGGGLNVFRPVVSFVQRMFSGKKEETSWQSEVRFYDLNHTGILGHSLDIIGFTASSARLMYVDRLDYTEDKNELLQQQIYKDIWRDGQDIFEILYKGVRALASVGEFDLIYVDGKYDILHCSQRISTYKRKDGTQITRYRQRAGIETGESVLEVESENIERCYVPEPGNNLEAYAPTRRVLPHLRLYSQIMAQFQNIARSNSLMTKALYLGEDDGDWQRNQEYINSFTNPSEALPPAVNDLTQLAQRIAKGDLLAPWYPLMGPTKPEAVDLTTSFDEHAREMLVESDKGIAEGLNIPARLIFGDNLTHFSDWVNDEQFRNFGVVPVLKVMIKFLDTNIFSKYALKYGSGSILWFSYDHVARTALNPQQFIELFKTGIVGSAEVRRQLGIPEAAKLLSPEDIQYRRELLTGDSGLQQDLLSARDARQSGMEKNAVPDSAPLTNGQKRMSNVGKAPGTPVLANPVTAAFQEETVEDVVKRKKKDVSKQET